MLKKHLFKGILLALPLFSNAQTDKQYELVADAACTCANKKDFTKLDKNAMSMELGMCMFTALEVLPEKDRKNFDFSNPAKAKGLGEKIGMKMAYKCPKIMLTLGTTMNESETETDKSSGPPPPPPPPPATNYTVEGKIKDVIEGDYVTILLVDKDGREHKLIWSNHFSGESDFIANPQGLKNKNVEVSYYLSERYVPKMHDYFSLKNINGLVIK
jgi:hypothetical protein